MTKRHYDFVLEETSIRQLKAFIMSKTGNLKKGDMSKWVEIAINNLVRNQQQVTTIQQRGLTSEEREYEDTKELMLGISKLIFESRDGEPLMKQDKITHQDISSCIMQVRNLRNDRMVPTWIDRLITHGFIGYSQVNNMKLFVVLDNGQPYQVQVNIKK